MENNVKYTLLDTGIHQFVWLKSSRDAIYEHAEKFRQVNNNLASGDVVKIIMDYRKSGIPSFITITDAMKKAGLRNDVTYVSAYIANKSMLETIINNAATMNNLNHTRQFFHEHELDIAINWLLSH